MSRLQQRRHRSAFKVEGSSVQTGVLDGGCQGMRRASEASIEQGFTNQAAYLVARGQMLLAQKPKQDVEDFISAGTDAGNDFALLPRPASLLPVIPALQELGLLRLLRFGLGMSPFPLRLQLFERHFDVHATAS